MEQPSKSDHMMQTNLRRFMFENDNLDDITTILEQGGIILYPTDTIWGIGCDACNSEAVKKIYDLKKRDYAKPFVLLVDSIEMLKAHVQEVHPKIDTLLMHHIRPLTVVYNQGKNLAPNAIGSDGSVAIRIVQDEFCKKMIRNFGRPVVATSANVSNEPFPSNFGSIRSDIIQGVDYVVKLRQHEKVAGAPSVIVTLSNRGELVFLRE